MRFTFVLMLALLMAPLAQAQEASYIGCAINGGPGAACTETPYGHGDTGPIAAYADIPNLPDGSTEPLWLGPGDGSCNADIDPPVLPILGQIWLRELDDCVVSANGRCLIEMPQRVHESGMWISIVITLDLGPLGIFASSANTMEDAGRAGNVGHRQLNGTCTNDGGEECALDSDCTSGTGCMSTCFSDPGTNCASHADCPVANDCVSEVFWDDIGTCTDDATLCTTDADCPAPEVCELGFDWERSDFSCGCCQSTTGALCGLFGLVEYPALSCPEPEQPEASSTQGPKWVFEGGRGTEYRQELNQVPGQQEGKCRLANDMGIFRSCGTLGDFWAGAREDKCIGSPPCPDPIIGDPTQGAMASPCDDVAFGGIAGDFCDLREPGIRENLGKNPDGSPDLTRCAEGVFALHGFPNEGCGVPEVLFLDSGGSLAAGDPQAGCRLANLGFAVRPDWDCNGVDDTVEGICMPVDGVVCSEPSLCPSCDEDGDCASGVCLDSGDLCPWIGEANRFRDTNNDGIGDECQCGDQNGDGAVTGVDIGATALCANGALPAFECDATRLDTDGDGTTTALDVGGVVSAVNGVISTAELICARNMDTAGVSTP